MRSGETGTGGSTGGQPLRNTTHRGPPPYSVGVGQKLFERLDQSINSPAPPFRAEKSQIYFG